MKNLKHIGLLAGITSLIFSSYALASGKNPEDNKEEKKTVGQKIGKETARVIGQVDKEGKKLENAFKKQRNKDKQDKKEEKERGKQERQQQKQENN